MSSNNSKTHILTESAIMIALATVLSMFKIWEAPYGGSVTVLSMAPIIVLSMRRGVKVGLVAGFVHSLIQLLLGLNNVAWVPTVWGIIVCVLTDYILPFTVLGLGGIFRNVKFTKNDKTNLFIAAALGALLVTLLRYLSHIVSGAVIWYALDLEWYADDPTHIVFQYGTWMFSVIYNGGYMVPEIITTTVGTPILVRALDRVKK
ncbi:MAG: energy-coupled thiamine transporter ThiT [Oscillospiraceae bacterium]|nr:energy-coupled thiamine transporter ThiT [Oscillospiraceae bacterium]